MKEVMVYSRSGCHLCEIAIDRINSVINDYKFTLNGVLLGPTVEKSIGSKPKASAGELGNNVKLY